VEEVDIMQRLDRIKERVVDPTFLRNQGLGNEVGIHIFTYSPRDELIVRHYLSLLKNNESSVYRIIECDLYGIFLHILEGLGVLKNAADIEKKRGKDYLLSQLHGIATPEAFMEHIRYSPHQFGDVLVISGVGKAYPFMRTHRVLNIMQQDFVDIPVIVLYPGDFTGKSFSLFNEFEDGNYYRAFNLL
jgi:hypothetical protein